MQGFVRPVFPPRVTLPPEGILPLHIEEHYKQMIGGCRKAKAREKSRGNGNLPPCVN
ncbi:MAG TPA: hypothetical protein VMW54_13660 [Terriglobia bacterium]|nr:hypothetical protein [Terriglobia bacterium]